jgi:MarR-like DNA-binding transcriptional regulator SgrR of sgrS sRNA
MNPREYYRMKTATITDKEIALVAACLSEHVGEENAVRIERLAARVGMGERQVRDMLETLVKQYGLPVGAKSGKAGRFLIANERERKEVLADLASRRAEIDERIKALQNAKLAPVSEPVKATQPQMFEVEDIRNLGYWGY